MVAASFLFLQKFKMELAINTCSIIEERLSERMSYHVKKCSS